MGTHSGGSMNVGDIMSKHVVTVEFDDRLSTVKDIFDNAKFHHLLVVEGGILFGVVSDRDLLKSISPNIGTNRYTPRDLETLNKPVHAIMSRKLITLGETASVEDAIALFNTHAISCIPIVDGDNHVLGIMTWRDILKHFHDIAKSTI